VAGKFIGYEGAPRFAAYIGRLTGDEEIIPPGVILENDPKENWYLKSVSLWTTGRITIAASVGNLSRVQVANPTIPTGQSGSALIVVVTGCVVVGKASIGSIALTIDAAAAATPTPNLALDTRTPLNTSVNAPTVGSVNLIANNTAAVSGYRYEEVFSTVAATDLVSRFLALQPVILFPGHNLTVFNQTSNEAIVAYLYGYERPARPEELAI